MPEKLKRTVIRIDRQWSLSDLSHYPHVLNQVYAFYFTLEKLDAENRKQSIYAKRIGNFPWRGGYSTVNFFSGLERDVPKSDQVQVNSIRYSSPGVLEILAIASAITAVATAVKSLVKSGDESFSFYLRLQKWMREKQLTKIDAQTQFADIDAGDKKYLEKSFDKLAKWLALPPEQIEQLRKSTPNALARVKLLMSAYRRVHQLKDFDIQGKAKIESSKA